MGSRRPRFRKPGVWFDLDHWLQDASLISRTRRAGVYRYIPMGAVDATLAVLIEKGIVSALEARELLAELIADGLLDPSAVTVRELKP